MGWLWPESDLRRARWSLNSAIYALRKLLNCAAPSTVLSSFDYILLEEDGYRLSPEVKVFSDIEEFDARCKEGYRLERAGRNPEALVEYEKATELYRGDFLVEELYEEWTRIERERLADAYTDLLRRLAINYMETGQLQESVQTCYQALEKDRCNEDTHRLLMECYVRLGQRARALRQYRLCEQALENECGTTPSSEIRALYVSILKDGGSC
jgi:DNA-binding SARP family transcriptional activator